MPLDLFLVVDIALAICGIFVPPYDCYMDFRVFLFYFCKWCYWYFGENCISSAI